MQERKAKEKVFVDIFIIGMAVGGVLGVIGRLFFSFTALSALLFGLAAGFFVWWKAGLGEGLSFGGGVWIGGILGISLMAV